MTIFVGNLSFDSTGADVKKLFEGFGNVVSVAIVMRKEKKVPKSRGFGFVEMPDAEQARAAIAALNGKEFMGRVLDVNPARPKAEAPAVRKPPAFKKRPALPASRPGVARPLGQPGAYRGGRRSLSYVKRRALAGLPEDTRPRCRPEDNPMRWPKKKGQPPHKAKFKSRGKPSRGKNR